MMDAKFERIELHKALAQSVKDHGLDVMFGLMGDANLFLANHFIPELKGEFVPVAYEGSAVLGAKGYGHVTGRDLNGLEGLGPVSESRTKPLLIELRLDPNSVPRMRK